MTGLYIPVRRLPHSFGLDLPTYATVGSAGMDLLAAVNGPIELLPGERRLIPTGLCVAVPQGFEMQIRPRSGLAKNHGVTVLNAPGTVDSDFRGEVHVLLVNTDHWKPFTVERGMRIAQAVFAAVVGGKLIEVEDLDATVRGAGGFGSTGL